MTKFNNQELISNYPNCTCVNPKLNSNKPIPCFKSGMHPTETRLSGHRKEVGMRERALVCFCQYPEKMVLESAKHSSSTQNVLAQYLKRIHIDYDVRKKIVSKVLMFPFNLNN